MDSKLYDVLGVSRNAQDQEIKRTYHRLAKEFHPDKNPEQGDRFKEISYAYDVLSDPKKRAVYDRYGLKGLQEGSGGDPFGGFGGAEGIFADLFGGSGGGMFFGGGRRGRQERRGESTVKPLTVSLEDLYTGKIFKKTIERKALCSECSGSGCKGGKASRSCADCRGSGVKMQFRQLGPGLVQQVQSACGKCGGEGSVVAEKDRCKACFGRKFRTETKEVEVEVLKGMSHAQKITLQGMGDDETGVVTGDWIYVVQQTEHANFERSGDNLILKREISLSEALCGFQFLVNQLDGRTLLVTRGMGEVIPSDSVQIVEGEGMPQLKNPFLKGNLLIKFTVRFPENHFADELTLKALEALLPPRPHFQLPSGDHVEEVDLNEFEGVSSTNATQESEDEEDDPRGARVGCAQQ